MTLNELRYIVAVARERHFGRAAEACFVSQPTLSVAVKKLEEELKVTLFERGNEVTVTPIGAEIVAQAQRVLEEAGVVRALAMQGRNQLEGPLRVGAIYTIGPYLLPRLIPSITKAAPRMPLVVEENYTAVLCERLRQGELDVIVISLPFEEAGLRTLPLYREPFVVLLPRKHVLANEQAVGLDALGQENVLLLGAGHCFRDQVLAYCPDCARGGSSTVGIQHSLQGSSLETIRYMVASGAGVTILPCSAAGGERFSDELVAVRPIKGNALPHRQVALAWRKSFTRPAVIEVLHDAILGCGLDCVEPIR